MTRRGIAGFGGFLLAVTVLQPLDVPATIREQCVGDCHTRGYPQINDLVGCLLTAVYGEPPSIIPDATCCDSDGDGKIQIHDVLAAVRSALNKCRPPRPTALRGG